MAPSVFPVVAIMPRRPNLSVPDFVCIGAQKSGTSWLYRMLVDHPGVFLPPANEMHFFDQRDQPFRPRHHELARKAARIEQERGAAADRAYLDYLARFESFAERSRDWYEAAYSLPVADGVKRGDITPGYLSISREQVAYARDLLGPARLILLVRRPADRLLSQLRMWAQRASRDDMPESEAEWLDLLRVMTRRTERGSYRRGLRLWRGAFGRESLLVLPFGDIRTDPGSVMERIEDHIGIAHHDDYGRLTKQIHVTQKVDLPEAVLAKAAELTAEEDDFLRRSFGEEFLARTR